MYRSSIPENSQNWIWCVVVHCPALNCYQTKAGPFGLHSEAVRFLDDLAQWLAAQWPDASGELTVTDDSNGGGVRGEALWILELPNPNKIKGDECARVELCAMFYPERFNTRLEERGAARRG